MNYMTKRIEQATSEELLHALLHINGIGDGPKKTTYHEPVKESLIAIGPDHTAHILIFADDVSVLNARVKQIDET